MRRDLLGLFLIPLVSSVLSSARRFPTCSEESLYLLDKATACWNREDVGCTKLTLERVLARQPGCAQALYLQSFVLERDGKVEEAERLREQAEKRDPQLEKFWEERGKQIEQTFLQGQDFSHFRLKFHRGEDRDKAWRAVRYLNEAYNEMGSQFGEFPEKKFEVIVLGTEEFVDTWRSPYIGGFFDLIDGKVRVRVDEVPGGETEYRRVCRHEFAHAYLYRLLPKELPLWFAEGTAEFYANRTTSDSYWKEKILDAYARALHGQSWMTLSEIHEAIKTKKDPRRIGLGYYYAHAFCLYTAKERGESWIPRVVEELRAGKTLDQAYEAVTGLTPEAMHEKLRKSWE